MTGDTTCNTITQEPKMLSLDAFSRAQMRLEAGRWRSLRAPTDSIAAIGGGVLLLRGREERGGEGTG